jgi:predicted dehydrogenase
MASLKIGMVGLDTSHCTAFTRLLNDPEDEFHVPGGRVTVAYPGGSPDFELSWSRVEGITAELRENYDVRILSCPEEVAEQSDAILLTAVDGRCHLELFRRIAPYKKPVFIDKPFAVSTRDAREMVRIAEEHQLPLMSASSLRYAEPLVKALEDMEQPFGCDAFGPMALEPTQPGLFWYGIHGVEMMYAALGTGCVRVRAVSHPRQDVVVGEWADGRIGTFRGNREGNASFGMLIHSGKGSAFADVTRSRKPYYAGLLEQVMTMFRSGSPPLDLGETLEIIRFIEAANESRATGRPVVLAGDDQENEA